MLHPRIKNSLAEAVKRLKKQMYKGRFEKRRDDWSSVLERISQRTDKPIIVHPTLDETDDIGVKYLIITTDGFVESLQMLIDHRTNRGLQCEVVLMNDIESNFTGLDTADKVRNCILDYYINYAIEYVLLCGDVEHVPTRGLYAVIGGEQDDDIAADVYFSNLDGHCSPVYGANCNDI